MTTSPFWIWNLDILIIRLIDSLPVACAETTGADYFLTCDDRLLKKQEYFNVSSLNPLEFVQKVMRA
jgi:predicted nucleic acid-binding protein